MFEVFNAKIKYGFMCKDCKSMDSKVYQLWGLYENIIYSSYRMNDFTKKGFKYVDKNMRGIL